MSALCKTLVALGPILAVQAINDNNNSVALYPVKKLRVHGAVEYHKYKETDMKISIMNKYAADIHSNPTNSAIPHSVFIYDLQLTLLSAYRHAAVRERRRGRGVF